jgi:hypothetical protein
VSPAIRQIIERCWSKDPKLRLTFDEIYVLLKNASFKVFNDVDEKIVELFASQVEKQESEKKENFGEGSVTHVPAEE